MDAALIALAPADADAFQLFQLQMMVLCLCALMEVLMIFGIANYKHGHL